MLPSDFLILLSFKLLVFNCTGHFLIDVLYEALVEGNACAQRLFVTGKVMSGRLTGPQSLMILPLHKIIPEGSPRPLVGPMTFPKGSGSEK